MSYTNHSAAKDLRNRLLEPLFHLGCALTGAGTVLLGSMLPRLSALWHLRDKDAALLLLVGGGAWSNAWLTYYNVHLATAVKEAGDKAAAARAAEKKEGAEAAAPFFPATKPIDAYNAAILDDIEFEQI